MKVKSIKWICFSVKFSLEMVAVKSMADIANMTLLGNTVKISNTSYRY